MSAVQFCPSPPLINFNCGKQLLRRRWFEIIGVKLCEGHAKVTRRRDHRAKAFWSQIGAVATNGEVIHPVVKKKPLPQFDVKIEQDGKQHSGSYTVQAGVVTVHSIYGTTSTQVRGSSPERIARILLTELVVEHGSK